MFKVISILVFLPFTLLFHEVSLGQESGSTKVAVIIAFTDGLAIEPGYIKAQQSELEEKGYNVYVAQESVPRFILNRRGLEQRQKARESIINQIKSFKILENETIETIVINTHGSSTENQTSLSLIGKISSTELDEEAQEIFEPLVGKTSQELKINLISCSTFCGEPEATKERALTFLKYFGASNGTLIGAKAAIQAPIGVLPSSGDFKLMTAFYIMSFSLNTMFYLISDDSLPIHDVSILDLFTTPLFISLFSVPVVYGVKLLSLIQEKLGLINQRLTFHQFNGDQIKVSPAHSFSKGGIYSCRSLLSSN